MDQLILVDENDREVGVEEKMRAHEKGFLHRAFSVFVFNQKGELLLQRRAFSKYHSGGLWTNTCCSHPRPGEETTAAAKRRLYEEMGFSCPLREIFSFVYREEFTNGLTENEFDHVLVGEWKGSPTPDKDEVEKWKWASLSDIERGLKENPDTYTCWFRICFEKVMSARSHSF